MARKGLVPASVNITVADLLFVEGKYLECIPGTSTECSSKSSSPANHKLTKFVAGAERSSGNSQVLRFGSNLTLTARRHNASPHQA